MNSIHLHLLVACSVLWGMSAASQAADVDLERVAAIVVEQTNKFRQEHDQSKISVDANLQSAAQEFAEFMAKSGKYGHQADGRTPAERATAADYEYCAVRENIAYQTNPQDLSTEQLGEQFTQGWIDSPHHRENMLAEFVTDTAVAVATSDGSTFYAVQMFGRPKSKSYRVTLTNRAESKWTVQIESNGGADEIELAPRSRLRMTRCFPLTLQLQNTDKRQRVNEAANLIIQDGENGPRIVEEEEKDSDTDLN